VGEEMKGLTLKEFAKILKEINKNHSLVTGRCIKYVDISFDFRTLVIWRVLIRPFGSSQEFTLAQRAQDDGSLLNEIMCWLKNGETKDKLRLINKKIK
jgi:hypothetical protein